MAFRDKTPATSTPNRTPHTCPASTEERRDPRYRCCGHRLPPGPHPPSAASATQSRSVDRLQDPAPRLPPDPRIAGASPQNAPGMSDEPSRCRRCPSRLHESQVDQSERARLEAIARDVARDWNLVLSSPFESLNYSYVAPASDDAVLKVVSPHDEESIHEADALELWAGDGAVLLLRADSSRRGLLLERVWPGSDLAALANSPAAEIAVDVGTRLWRPAGAPFQWIGHHVPRWLADAQPESAAGPRLQELARDRFDQLDLRSDTLVHGDLHHHNILNAGNRYVAIDPKPMLGEPEFDVPPFLWNPTRSQMTLEESERRLNAFAEAGLDQRRMRAWALIRGAYLTRSSPQ